jgi:hypothetical protein
VTPTPKFLNVNLNKSTFKGDDLFEVYVSFDSTVFDWDGYLVIVGNGGVWSILRKGLKAGVHPIISNAMEVHQPYSGKVFSMRVPYGVPGSYLIYAAILQAGLKPTLQNAQGGGNQLAVAPFQVE